jgi:hypothetical protein
MSAHHSVAMSAAVLAGPMVELLAALLVVLTAALSADSLVEWMAAELVAWKVG